MEVEIILLEFEIIQTVKQIITDLTQYSLTNNFLTFLYICYFLEEKKQLSEDLIHISHTLLFEVYYLVVFNIFRVVQ